MKKSNILNLGLVILFGLGSLTARTSKPYALPESSQLIDLSSCTDSNFQAQQYESGGLNVLIYGDLKYSQSSNLIDVNNEEILTNCSDRSGASENKTALELVGVFPHVRGPIVRLVNFPRVGTWFLEEAYPLLHQDRFTKMFREFHYEHSKTPDLSNEYNKSKENIRSTISGSDGYREKHTLSNQERKLQEKIASLRATMRVDQ